MKKFFIIFFLLSITAFAQKYEDIGWMSKFGAAVGYTPSWIVPKTDDLNKQLNIIGLSSVAKNGLFVSGGGGYIYLMLIKDLRIGGTGYSGSVSEKSIINGITTQADYSISGGGLALEYTLPFVRRVGISIGAVLGSGNVEISVFKNNGEFNWADIWNEFEQGSNNKNISRKLSNNFYTFTPTINFDFPITRFAALRLGGGYQFTFDNEWKIENENKLLDVPSGFDGNAYFLQAGLFVGFFAF